MLPHFSASLHEALPCPLHLAQSKFITGRNRDAFEHITSQEFRQFHTVEAICFAGLGYQTRNAAWRGNKYWNQSCPAKGYKKCSRSPRVML